MTTFHIVLKTPNCTDGLDLHATLKHAIHTEFVLSGDSTLKDAKVTSLRIVPYPFHEMQQVLRKCRLRAEHLESLAPEWAKGYTSDSIAAQTSIDAKLALWELLGVTDQTAAIASIQELLS